MSSSEDKAKGRAAAGWLIVGCASAALLGCTTTKRATPEQLRVRSAFDLGCPPTLVQIGTIDERTRGVVGCGHRLAYVESCEQVGSRRLCTWVPDAYEWLARVGGSGGPTTGAVSFGSAVPAGLVCTVVPSPGMPSAAPPPQPAPAPGGRWGAPPLSVPPPAASAPPPELDPFEDRH